MKDLKKKLTRAFPEAAKQKKEYGGFKGTGYVPGYITERLNEVFGYDGWKATLETWVVMKDGNEAPIDVLLTDKFATVYVKLEVNWDDKKATRWQFGTCNITEKGLTPGEAIKGAFTDALKKCAGYLDIGNDAYKGEVEVGYRKADGRPKQKASQEKTGKVKGPEGYQELVDRVDKIAKGMNMPPEELDEIARECGAVDYASAIPEHLEEIVKILAKRFNEWQKEKKGE